MLSNSTETMGEGLTKFFGRFLTGALTNLLDGGGVGLTIRSVRCALISCLCLPFSEDFVPFAPLGKGGVEVTGDVLFFSCLISWLWSAVFPWDSQLAPSLRSPEVSHWLREK